jgi:hypothetical protein
MTKGCTHIAGIRDVTPSALGCQECLKIGSVWLHLRICRSCGHVGCCDDSPNKHATKHFHATGIPSSKATTRLKDGAGVMWMKFCSTSRTARRRITVRFRVTIEGGFSAQRGNIGWKTSSPTSTASSCII